MANAHLPFAVWAILLLLGRIEGRPGVLDEEALHKPASIPIPSKETAGSPKFEAGKERVEKAAPPFDPYNERKFW